MEEEIKPIEIPQKEYELINNGFDDGGNPYFDIRVVVSKNKCSPEFIADIFKSRLVNNPMYKFTIAILSEDAIKISRNLKAGIEPSEALKLLELLK
jgi:hypothetical protein